MQKETKAIIIGAVIASSLAFLQIYPTLGSGKLSSDEFLISVLISENSNRLTRLSIELQEAVLIQQNLIQTLLFSEILYPDLNKTELYFDRYLPKYNETLLLINEANSLIIDHENESNYHAKLIREYEDNAILSIQTKAVATIMTIFLMYAVIIIILFSIKKKKKILCPYCKSSNIRERTTKTPKYRCDKCKNEFNKPIR